MINYQSNRLGEHTELSTTVEAHSIWACTVVAINYFIYKSLYETVWSNICQARATSAKGHAIVIIQSTYLKTHQYIMSFSHS